MRRLLPLAIALLATQIVFAGVAGDSALTDQAIVHVLNRVGFGPAPGDVERVRAIGVMRYIERQLRPERIPDSAMETRLKSLPSIAMSSREITEKYELSQLEARRIRKEQANATSEDQPKTPDPVQQKANSVIVELSEQKLLRAMYSERQLQEVLTDFWFNHFNVDARKGRDRFLVTAYERDTI